ncbi:Phage tail protein [Amycolatopsis sulphurea]|uniref:Phage tail protein n=1 Tax=Amycolatopsis sulphurea TaxID=76022 RepID=A0A2A9FC31_9PSEU|nr:hypothetical protein [Amycolatopsis sulphurea]PFG48112.1 Phage tail protein [Amycolatopsis sulphurea]
MQVQREQFAAAQRAALNLTGQWMAEYRGLVIGAPDSALSLVAVDGLLDTPGLRTSDQVALARHGEVGGPDYLGSRTVSLTIEVYGRDATEFDAALADVMAAFSPALPDAPFTFWFPGVAGGGRRFVSARVRKRAIPVNVEYSNHLAMVTAELYCPSPIIVTPELLSGRTSLANPDSPGGGTRTPFRFPIRFGRAAERGIVRVLNDGNFIAYPKFTVRGAVADPQIVNRRTGEALTLSYALLRDEWLDVDTYTHEVLLNGVAPRFLTSGTGNTWLTCPPGLTEFVFRGRRIGSDSGDDAELVCEWSPTWV